jgi:hypothetical protein
MILIACKNALLTADWDCRSEAYIYVTAKTLFVTKQSPGNRPGWHADGFGSNGDLNYIWCDKNPTEFAVQDDFNISDDDKQSMVDMDQQSRSECIRTYPNQNLLRLDEGVIHRVGPVVEEGVRKFVKITISRHQFVNEGNSRNYLLPETLDWSRSSRSMERNLDHAGKNNG